MILTKKGTADRRYLTNRQQLRSVLIAKILLSFIFISAAIAIALQSIKQPRWVSPKATGRTNEIKVQEVKAIEIPCDYDPITYLRCRGRQLGINDFTISKIIRVAQCESHLNPDALNKNTNGTFDVGIFQINTVHGQKNMTDFVKNIDYGFKLFQEQGFSPWLSSAKCWGK